MARNRGSDPVADFFAEASTSVRHELIERGWFGRVVTPAPQALEPYMAEQLGWVRPAFDGLVKEWDALSKKLEIESPRSAAHNYDPLRGSPDRDLDR